MPQLVGSIADRDLVRRAIADNGIEAIVHSGALHKPDIERRPREDFIEVNIRGTFNLLEEAVANGVGRFVFTSTTSLMISEAIRAGLAGGAARAAWLTEDDGRPSRATSTASPSSPPSICAGSIICSPGCR